MKKYLLPILIPSMFIAFITYATVKTSAISSDIEGQEEFVLVEDVGDVSKSFEDKKVDESFTTIVASPVISIAKEIEPSKTVTETIVTKKYYQEDDYDDEYDEDEDDEDGEDDRDDD